MKRRKNQPGDRHRLPAPIVYRLPNQLVTQTKRRAIDETDHTGEAVSMRAVWERAFEQYLRMPVAKADPGDDGPGNYRASAIRLPIELRMALRRRAIDEALTWDRQVSAREVAQRAIEAYLKTPLPR